MNGDTEAVDADRKAFATLQARLALVGWTLARIEGGGFIATRWGRGRDLADLAAVEEFAQQLGAPA